MRSHVGPKMEEVGPKTIQSGTNMAPGNLTLATSWPQYGMKADRRKTFVNQGEIMIFHISCTQVWLKMAQVGARSSSSWLRLSEVGHKLTRVWYMLAKTCFKVTPKRSKVIPRRLYDAPRVAQNQRKCSSSRFACFL